MANCIIENGHQNAATLLSHRSQLATLLNDAQDSLVEHPSSAAEHQRLTNPRFGVVLILRISTSQDLGVTTFDSPGTKLEVEMLLCQLIYG